ncbi:MAG TPA: hypothetical protein VE999_06990 [Gemmataceae bacterium]|jgi:hypothetical protein|nr:hypothetical protein [Gemmataceae bacterium]
MSCRNPFELPDRLETSLQAVLAFWQGLRRGQNGMPFGDDLLLPQLSELPGKLFLLAVFAPPERFRIEFLNSALPAAATGKFLDELPPSTEFAFLRAQASATLEAAAPTLLRLTDSSGDSFSRLLLPMWGNGQVSMILGAL